MSARLISILINNYNYGRFLREAIDSALGQTYPHVEVVVVDDGSTDDSREIIATYGTRIRAVLKQNGGQGSAYNAGFAASTGEIIMMLDSDDYLKPLAAERIVSVWGADVQIVHHRLQITDLTGKTLGHWPNLPLLLDSGDVTPKLLRTGVYSAPPSSGLAYGRRLLQQLLPMREEDFRICADACLVLQSPFLAQVTVLDEVLGYYRIHGTNNWGLAWPTRTSSRSRLESVMFIRDRSQALIKKRAQAQGLKFNPLDWETSITLRWKLLVMRLGSIPSTRSERGGLVKEILMKIEAEPYTIVGAIKERLVVLSIWKAPPFFLKFLFPNMMG